jgi:pyruvate dehydrogenase E1 component alpha subunit
MTTMLKVIGEGQKAKRDGSLDLSDKDLMTMYETMVRVQVLDHRLTNLQRQGRIGFYLAGTGQEATQIGMAYALEPDDWMFPHYRDPASALIRGVSVQAMVHQCFGNAKDPVKGRQMPVHYSFRENNYVSISSPLATQIPQAVGAAWAMKIKGEKNVVLTSFGDGSSSEGDFHVAMNFAGVFKVPCVFVLENNHWAISVPLKFQTASETFAEKAQAYGFEGVRVDGNDVLAVYKATKDAVDKARSGGGPTLIECVTYRMTSHSTSDEASRYQPKDEVAKWKKKDPVDRFEKYLKDLKLLSEKQIKEIRESAEAEVKKAVKEAEGVGPPPAETIFDDVYASRPPHLDRQWNELKEELED